jgi:hypothetical protein
MSARGISAECRTADLVESHYQRKLSAMATRRRAAAVAGD